MPTLLKHFLKRREPHHQLVFRDFAGLLGRLLRAGAAPPPH